MTASSILAFLLLLSACRHHPCAGDDGSPIQLLIRHAVPPDVRALSCEPPVKRTYSTTITCQMTVASGEQSYWGWIRKAFSPRFHFRQTVDNHLWLTRYEAGEMQRFDIAVEPGSASLSRVRIVLFVDAD